MTPRLLPVLITAALSMGATCAGEPQLPLVAGEPLRPVLGPSDHIEVRVFGEEELSGEHRVTPDGTIRMPLVGTVSLDGKTPEDAAVHIAALYNKDYLRDAQVTVVVREFNSRKVFILGRVRKPGPYPYEENMTIIGALARAGGESELADLNATVVTRRGVDGEQQKRVTIRVADIRRGNSADIPVEPGDIIFVPESPF